MPLYLILSALLAGCGAIEPRQQQDESVEKGAEVDGDAVSLTPEIVYNVLLGEIAIQRRQLDLAYTHQLDAALLAGDAKAAERATRIAIHQQNFVQALEAAEHWVELAPEDFEARMMATMAAIRVQEPDKALEHLRMVVSLTEAKGEDGFLHAVSTVVQARENQLGLEVMQRLAADYPDDPRADYAVALTAVLAKEYEIAETRARQVLARAPDMEKAHVLLARVLITRNDKEGARTVLREGAARFPEHKAINAAYGRLLVELNETEQAYAQFKKMRRLLPDSQEVLLSLGILAVQLDRREAARGHFLELMELGKSTDEAAYYLGRIGEEEKKPKEAIDWYRKVKDNEQLRLDARTRIARLLAEQGELEQARELLRELRREIPDRAVDVYLLEGGILNEFASPEAVRAHYDGALQVHPDNNELLYARGLHASTQGQLGSAEQDLRKIIQQDPNHADALNALGYTLADQTDRHQEALGYIQQALKLKPKSPAILDSMGWVQYRLGNNEEALRYLRQAYGSLPDGEIAAHLGEVLWVTGNREEAREVWQDALIRDPDHKYLMRTIQRLDK
jgi:tetratricopeptide (TPR) repeat protein